MALAGKRRGTSRRSPAQIAAAKKNLVKARAARSAKAGGGTGSKSLPSTGTAAAAKARAFARKPKGASAQNAGSKAASAAKKALTGTTAKKSSVSIKQDKAYTMGATLHRSSNGYSIMQMGPGDRYETYNPLSGKRIKVSTFAAASKLVSGLPEATNAPAKRKRRRKAK